MPRTTHQKQSGFATFFIILFLAGLAAILSGYYFFTHREVEGPFKVYKIGVLSLDGLDLKDTLEGFKSKLNSLGYIEGKNISYEIVNTSIESEEIKAAALKLVNEKKVDLIFAYPTAHAIGSKIVTKNSNTPVIFAITTIEGADLVQSIRQPGGNVTGVRVPTHEITLKKLEYLKEISPNVKNILTAYKNGYPPSVSTFEVLKPVADSLGINLVELKLNNPEDLKTYFIQASSSKTKLDAIFIMPDSITPYSGLPILLSYAKANKIPIIGLNHYGLSQGALLTYFPENYHSGELAAILVDKVFEGANPGNIPVVTPESVLKINYKVAQELGLSINESILGQASEIIH